MQVFPFAFALASALICSGQRIWFVLVPTILCIALISQDVYMIGGAVFCLFVMSIARFFICKGRDIKSWGLCIVFFLSQVPYLYFLIFSQSLGLCALYAVASVASFYVFYRLFMAFGYQPFLYRFKSFDLACLAFLVMVLAGGISTINAPYIDLYHLIGVFSIFIVCRLCGSGFSVIYAILYGLGAVITYSNTEYVAWFALVALVAYYLKTNIGVYSVLGVIICEGLLGLYFGCITDFSYLVLVQTLIAGAVYLCVPRKYLKNLRMYFVEEHKEYGVRDIANANRSLIKNRLIELSNVFFEMDIVFKKMLKGVVPIEQAKQILVSECQETICRSCKDKLGCVKQNLGIQKHIEMLMSLAFEKGKITLLDLPSEMANNCKKSSQIINCINKLLTQYRQYAGMIKNLDNSRLLIADQLHGVADIMKNLSSKFDEKMSLDDEQENKIILALTEQNINCSEALVYQTEDKIKSVTLLINTKDIDEKAIEKIIKNCMNLSMNISQVKPSDTSGWSLVSLEPTNKYKIMYAYSTDCKNGNHVNGDCFSALNVGENKFLLAISDGMGHGEKARKNSEMTISVVENFYKAGFDNEVVLSSVNKLLNLNQLDDFATLDMCVIDLKNCFVDLIKLGASPTFLKHELSCEVIEGSGLPLGVLEEVKTVVKRTALEINDIIILASDGVSDCFGSVQNMYEFVNHIKANSPQEIADIIRAKVQVLSGGDLQDDVTILVARILSNI